jgi:undecaprenyl-phosphate galactose phosphotransferase
MVLMRRNGSLRSSTEIAGRQTEEFVAVAALPRLRLLYDAESFSPRNTRSHGTARRTQIAAAGLLVADLSGAAFSLGVAAVVAHCSVADTTGLLRLLPWLACALAGMMFHFASHRLYSRRLSVGSEFQMLLPAAAGALLATSFAAFLTQNEQARVPVVLGWASFPFAALAARMLARRALRAAGVWNIPVVVVGDGSSADAAIDALRAAPGLGYEIVARIVPSDLPHLLTVGSWHGILHQRGAQMVVLAHDACDTNRPPPRVIEALARERVAVAVMHSTHGLPALGCEQISFVGHETVMRLHPTLRTKPVSRLLKAATDVTGATAGLLILLPLFAIICVMVKMDGGPALFSHTRIGGRGRPFKCLKFRTMVCHGDAVLQRVLAENPYAAQEWAATQKLRCDPRVTWIGRFLRKTSLDELPQLINVLRLEMSLVGPRPIVRREINRYADDIAYYYDARPGITGLWQVSGRNDTSYARRVELDRWYVKNWTFWQDLAILARTLPAVLSGRGAS